MERVVPPFPRSSFGTKLDFISPDRSPVPFSHGCPSSHSLPRKIGPLYLFSVQQLCRRWTLHMKKPSMWASVAFSSPRVSAAIRAAAGVSASFRFGVGSRARVWMEQGTLGLFIIHTQLGRFHLLETVNNSCECLGTFPFTSI